MNNLGYGFSSTPAKKGFNFAHTARIFVELMHRLGHNKFFCQGGDWGAMVTSSLATLYQENVLGRAANLATRS